MAMTNTVAMKAPKLKVEGWRQWQPLFTSWMGSYSKAWQLVINGNLKFVQLLPTKVAAAAVNRGVTPQGEFYIPVGGDAEEVKIKRELELISLNFIFFALQFAVQDDSRATELVASVPQPNAREAWRVLHQFFEPMNASQRHIVQQELQAMKQSSGESVKDYIVRFKAKQNDLARLNGSLPDLP